MVKLKRVRRWLSWRGSRIQKRSTKPSLIKKAPEVLVLTLLCVAGLNLVTNGVTVIQASLTVEESELIDKTVHEEITHSSFPSPEVLAGTLEDIDKSHFEKLSCNTSSTVKAYNKSQNKHKKANRKIGDIKKLEKPEINPTSQSCGDTTEKLKDAQTRLGANTDGYLQGADGAESLASDEGSMAEFALTRQNEMANYEATTKLWAEKSFGRYCNEIGDPGCKSQASNGKNWLLPVTAMATYTTINQRQFQEYLANARSQAADSIYKAKRTEARVMAEMTAWQNALPQKNAIEQLTAKQQEVNANQKVLTEAVLAFETKFDQGGVSPNCAAQIAFEPKTWWQNLGTVKADNCQTT